MPSDKTLRATAGAFAVLFALVVASGWVPGWYSHVGHERVQWGLFVLSPLDDITHGVTAVAALAAALHSARAARLFFVTFGSYYALDALFFLLYGAVNEKTWTADVALNMPHVLISAAMLAMSYGLPRGVSRARDTRGALGTADSTRAMPRA
jgi:hypothetical protein